MSISEYEFKIVCNYLKHLAANWWKAQPENRGTATCDSCSSTVARNDGYLIGSNLYCEQCFKENSAMIRKNPDSAGTGTLQAALKWAGNIKPKQNNITEKHLPIKVVLGVLLLSTIVIFFLVWCVTRNI